MKQFFESEAKAKRFAQTVNDPWIYKESAESIGIQKYNSTPWCVEYDTVKTKKVKMFRKVYKDGRIQYLPKYVKRRKHPKS